MARIGETIPTVRSQTRANGRTNEQVIVGSSAAVNTSESEGEKELGIDVNAMDKDGSTTVHVAAEKGHVDTLRVLVNELGEDVNAADTNGVQLFIGQLFMDTSTLLES